MDYISTRGQAPRLNFADTVLAGLAEDGGLYVPAEWPQLSSSELAKLKGKSYQDVAVAVLSKFVADEIPRADVEAIVKKAYGTFHHPDIAPVRNLSGNLYMMELIHGPTLAFKDYALQFLGVLFDYILEKRNQQLTIVGATSGDTGSAAIEGCRGRDRLRIFILHPHNRVSDVQRKQMTTVLDDNVTNIAIEGTFDDCQDIVKSLFNDLEFRRAYNLSAINSINWARILAQVVYYVWAYLNVADGREPVSFSVPTGNFGNVFAAYAAKQMGLPINKFIIGSNKNDILTRYFQSGEMVMQPVDPSLSPSMDIQVSSNFERLMFDMLDRDGAKVAAMMHDFRKTGRMALPLTGPARDFMAWGLDDAGTLSEIKAANKEYKLLIDPHTAVGLHAARQAAKTLAEPVITLACAHPAKFPDAVKQATGIHPPLPDFLADLFEREERLKVMKNDVDGVKKLIAQSSATPTVRQKLR